MEKLSSTQHQELAENLIKIGSKLPHQSLVCQVGFEKALEETDWKKAVQFFAAGFLNDSILSGDDDDQMNHWKYVMESTPVYINDQIYLFPL